MNCRSGLNSVSRSTGLPSLTGTLSYSSAGRDGLTELIRIWQNTSHSKTINISLISHNTRPNAFIMWKHKHHYSNAIRASGQQTQANRCEYNHLCLRLSGENPERLHPYTAGIKSLILHQSLRTNTRGLDTLAANWIIQWRQMQLLHDSTFIQAYCSSHTQSTYKHTSLYKLTTTEIFTQPFTKVIWNHCSPWNVKVFLHY